MFLKPATYLIQVFTHKNLNLEQLSLKPFTLNDFLQTSSFSSFRIYHKKKKRFRHFRHKNLSHILLHSFPSASHSHTPTPLHIFSQKLFSDRYHILFFYEKRFLSFDNIQLPFLTHFYSFPFSLSNCFCHFELILLYVSLCIRACACMSACTLCVCVFFFLQKRYIFFQISVINH